MATTTTTLPTLLSTKPILLVYTIPLLIISVLLTFAGTFLILDRSYSFSPRHGRTDKYIYPLSPRHSRWKRHKHYEDDDDPKRASFEQEKEPGWFWWWRLEAGVGGLAVGYLFGLHLTTFLFLLFPVLSPPAFLSVSIVSSVALALLSARFKVATFLFSSLSSAFLTSLVLCLILHPPLLGRYIILGVISPLVTLPITVVGILSTYFHPSPKSSSLIHIFLRITTSTTGAFSFLLAVSLLPNPPLPSWPNAYSRLYISDGSGWGTTQEKGLVAAWFFFAALGFIEDWALKHWLGQNPDEKWDEYLDWYVREMPYDAVGKREGDWKPLPGFWERIFGNCTRRTKEEHEIGKTNPLLFGDEEELQDSPPLSLLPTKPKNTVDEDGTDDDDDDDDYTLPSFVTKRRKKNRFAKLRAQLRGQGKMASKSVGFRPVAGGELDDGSLSSATLVASRGTRSTESGSGSAVEKNDASYSDVEVDLTAMAADVGLGEGRPKFLQRHMSKQNATGDDVGTKGATRSPKNGDRARERVRAFVAASPTRPSRPLSISLSQSHLPMTHQSPTPPLTPVPSLPASVPATPSLLNAIKRVEVARQQAYGADGGMGVVHETPSNEKVGAAVDGLPAGIKDSNGWDDFWTEVKSKARSP
ncbi:hypothetical protein JOM56_005536 [Amanita muscaria]